MAPRPGKKKYTWKTMKLKVLGVIAGLPGSLSKPYNEHVHFTHRMKKNIKLLCIKPYHDLQLPRHTFLNPQLSGLEWSENFLDIWV